MTLIQFKFTTLFVLFSFLNAFTQDINIGIKNIDIPEYPRGDYVPFTNCQFKEVTKFRFYVENRGADFNKSGKGIYGCVKIIRLSDNKLLLNEEKVLSFSGFTPGWFSFRFEAIDLSQPGLYEVSVESYITNTSDKSFEPIDSDYSDNIIKYYNQVYDPETLEKGKSHFFDFDNIETKKDLANLGWNFSYLPDSIRISKSGIAGSNALEFNLTKENNKRQVFTSPVHISEYVVMDFAFKLIDKNTGENITEELMSNQGLTAQVSFQKLCSSGYLFRQDLSSVEVTPLEDGFYKFAEIIDYYSEDQPIRGRFDFINKSDYKDVLIVLENVIIKPRDLK